ncbi:hypothetical protein SLS54_009805 [Diplodia seriata]
MPYLQVPGANLWYEATGTGPYLLLIPGADGRGAIFAAALPHLSRHFTVITWDRRGFSSSHPVGPQDLSARLATDADDAHRLLQHVAGDNTTTTTTTTTPPAFVMGTSSGAIVAMALLAAYPASIARLIAHEPPAFAVLPAPHRAAATAGVERIYAEYRARGPGAAMHIFTSAEAGLAGAKDGAHMRAQMDGARSHELRANALWWFEFELRQYTGADVDVEGLKRAGERFVPVVGRDSVDGPGLAPVKAVAGEVGREVGTVAGAHLGFVTDAEEWAESLRGLLLD